MAEQLAHPGGRLGAGERAVLGVVAAAAPPTTAERPGPDAGDGPWSIEYAVEVTPLEA